MTTELKLCTALALILGVSACSSSSTLDKVTIDAAEQAKRSFAKTTDGGTQDVGKLVANGGTVTARKVGAVGQWLNYGNGETSPAEDVEVSIVKNESGELNVAVNGVVTAFTPADRRVFVDDDGKEYVDYDIDDDENNVYVGAWSQTSSQITEFLNEGDRYHQVLGYQSNQHREGGEPNLRVYAVLGTETADDDLKSLPKATYNGRAKARAVPYTGFESNNKSAARFESDVTMTADFGAGEISGKMTNLEMRENRYADKVAVEGSITMETATFDVNGYQGKLTGVGEAATKHNFEGTYSGAFYGPAAEETAGTLRMTGTSEEGVKLHGAGYFSAD